MINDQVLASPDQVLGAFEGYTPKNDYQFDEDFKHEMKSKFRDILSKSTEHNLESTEKDVTEKELVETEKV